MGATGMVGTMVTAAMAMVETKDMEVATDMVVARDTALAKAMEETMAATRAMVAATEATRAMVAAMEATRAMVATTEATRATVVTKGTTRTRATVATKATEEIKDMASLTAATKGMASSLMAATKDTEGNRAVTTTRATAAGAREGMQHKSTVGKPPDTPHDSSKNWLV